LIESVASTSPRPLRRGSAFQSDPVFWGVLVVGSAMALAFSSAIARGAPPTSWLALVLLLPVVEEIVFRGWVQSSLLKLGWGARGAGGMTAANLATSILFGAAHLFSQPPAWAAAVVVPSLCFGYARDRYGSVLPAAVLHVAFNGCFFLA